MNRAFALLLLSLPLTAAAQIYKWTDANGQVHYGQNPPPKGSYKDVSTDLPPLSGSTAGGAPATTKRAAASNGSSSGGAAQAQMQAKADNAERCAKARERISFLQEKTAHRLFVTGDDGQPARMTDEQFDAQVKDAQDAADKYCS